MKDNFLNTGVLYEQLALDYFLAHVFPEKHYFYSVVRYKEQINDARWSFVLLETDRNIDRDGYDKDDSVTIPPSGQQLMVAPKPANIRITEDNGATTDDADELELEVFRRMMLKNGHYLVNIEVNGYRFNHLLYIEINPANTVVVNCFERRITF